MIISGVRHGFIFTEEGDRQDVIIAYAEAPHPSGEGIWVRQIFLDPSTCPEIQAVMAANAIAMVERDIATI